MSNIKQHTYGVYDNSYGFQGSVTPKMVNLSRSRTGYDKPDFRFLIDNKKDATTPLEAYEESCTVYQASMPVKLRPDLASQNYTDTSCGLTHGLNSCLFKVPQRITLSDAICLQAQAIARTNAYEYLRELQDPLQVQILAGELKETIQFLRHPLEQSIKTLVSFRRTIQTLRLKEYRDFTISGKSILRTARPSKRLLKDIAKLWLEARFALLPLIGDLNKVLQLIQEQQDRSNLLRHRVYGEASRSENGINGLGAATINGIVFSRTLNWNLKAQCIIHFGFKTETLGSYTLEQVDESLLSLETLPSAFWELTPYSWLVDYFVNIGDIIQAGTTSQGLLSYSSESLIRTTEYAQESRFHSITQSYILSAVMDHPKSVFARRRDINRIGGSIGIPPIIVTLPGSKIRYANIAALLGTKL